MVQGIGWCGVHRCSPGECFRIHYPKAHRPTASVSPDLEAALAATLANYELDHNGSNDRTGTKDP